MCAKMIRLRLKHVGRQCQRALFVPLGLPIQRGDGEVDLGVRPAGPTINGLRKGVAGTRVVKVAHQRDAAIVQRDVLGIERERTGRWRRGVFRRRAAAPQPRRCGQHRQRTASRPPLC